MVRAAPDKVPALNPHQIDDLMMAGARQGGESGFNIARVAVALGYDFRRAPRSTGTVRRRCRPPDGLPRDQGRWRRVFISAGVETGSPGSPRETPTSGRTPRTLGSTGLRNGAGTAGADEWHDPRTDEEAHENELRLAVPIVTV